MKSALRTINVIFFLVALAAWVISAVVGGRKDRGGGRGR